MKGLIFSIKRYSIHDGPGIRVTFFMKGCPLCCRWCHNPEGILPHQETVISRHKIGGREFGTREQVGIYYSADDILDILERERIFMEQSGGGVTFSGGEPMMQSEFLGETLRKCKEAGFSTAVDTSGYATLENFVAIIPYTDIFLFDIKHIDSSIHESATGVSNTLIISNYLYLLENAREVNLRIPVIPGFNNDAAHLDKIIDFISSTKKETLKRINLLPYHKIGSTKYGKFGLPYRMVKVEPPTQAAMNDLRILFLETGLKVKIGG